MGDGPSDHHGRLPGFSVGHLEGVSKTLSAGLPVLRHKKSAAHGQGANVEEVERHFAAYALHLAATNVVFIVDMSLAASP